MNYKSCWIENQQFCDKVLDELNSIRASPKNYIQYINEYIKNCKEDCLCIPGSDMAIVLEEGVKIVSEVISSI